MDWQALIQRLRDKPREMTLAQIAERVDAPLSTISDIARGATQEPRGNIAVRLLQLEQIDAGKNAA